MAKIIIIEACRECPYFREQECHNPESKSAFTGSIKGKLLPDDCPLSDAPEEMEDGTL